ncbi:MAG: hypothetical protein ACOYOP_03400 [Microthrixaceae bacterium]
MLGWFLVAAALNWIQQVAWRWSAFGWSGTTTLLPGRFQPFAGRIAWDAGLYLRVAEHGYRLAEGLEAGFPGYALAIRAVHSLGVDWGTAAVLVSMASGLAVALLAWAWMLQVGLDLRVRRTALAFLLLYPWAFVLFGVAYSDPLLMALVLGAVVLAGRDHWVLAGVVGGAATAVRPTGLAVVPALVVAALDRNGALVVPARVAADPSIRTVRERVVDAVRRGWATCRGVRLRPRRLRPVHAAVLLSLWGVVAYMVFLQRHAGDPLYFWSTQVSGGYGHGGLTDWHTWIKASFLVEPLLEIFTPADVLNELGATLVFVAAVVCAPALGRRFGWALTALAWSLAAMAWLFTRWMAPSGRYLLPVVPFLAALVAPWFVARPTARAVVLVLSAGCSVALAIGFAGWFDVHW